MLELLDTPLGADVRAVFTGRDRQTPALAVGQPGNLAHRRPHRPADLAAARRQLAAATGTDPTRWHLLHQVHGAEVAVVTEDVPAGTELRGVDGAVTRLVDRPLVVQTADCAPVLLVAPGAIGVAHAGRAGVLAGVASATVAALRRVAEPGAIRAAIGPTIGPCCYEVGAELAAAAEPQVPGITATTSWGTPSLDLPGALREELEALEVSVPAARPPCTRCDERFFSHRRDPASGRQVGLLVRLGEPGR
ncbi:MAG: polyphenol oxidase family protein [Nitriliruptoraceae bacterium]